MRKFLLLIFLIFLRLAQAQSFNCVYNYNNYWDDIGTSVGTDKMGNAFVSGTSKKITGGSPAIIFNMLYKFNSSGTLLWKDTLQIGVTKSVSDIYGNTYVIGGSYINKYDSTGQLTWSQNIPANVFANITLYSTNGVVVCGWTNINNSANSIIYRFDSNGLILWNRIGDFPCGGSVPICCDKNGCTYIASPDNGNNGFVIKIDNAGSIISTHTITNYPTNISVSNDLSIYLSCSASTSAYVKKYNQNGLLTWAKLFSGNYFEITDIITDQNNNLYCAGYFLQSLNITGTTLTCNGDEMFAVKFDALGPIIWAKNTTGQSGNGSVNPFDIILNSQNDLILTGNISGAHYFDSVFVNVPSPYPDVLLCKIKQGIITSIPSQKKTEQIFTIYPSPTSGMFNIECGNLKNCNLHITVTNSVGQKVYTESNPHFEGNYSKVFDLGRLAKGIYFVEVNTGEQRTVKKVVLE